MSKSAWTTGSWAEDAERAEQEELEKPPESFQVRGRQKEEEFPTLGKAVAAANASKGKKKKEKVTLSLAEFAGHGPVGLGARSKPSGFESEKLTTQELLELPTGPRERSEEEAGGGLGGGFKDYGGQRGDRYGDRERGRGREGGFGRDSDRDGEDRRRDRSRDEFDGPSRADESSNWGAEKKFTPSSNVGGGGGFRDRYGDDRRQSDRDGPSKADEVDNWGAAKKFTPSAPAGGGGSFGDRRGPSRGFEERGSRGGFEGSNSRADEVDNWGAAKKFAPSASAGGRPSGDRDGDRWARREEPDRWSRREEAKEETRTERPRLVLQKRTKPLDSNVPAVAEKSADKPDPFGGAKPKDDFGVQKETAAAKENGVGGESTDASAAAAAPSKPKVNPFGDAKPRELLLEEKGMDWRKMEFELEHKKVDRPEAAEETELKKEIEDLKAKLEVKEKTASQEVEAEEGDVDSSAAAGNAEEVEDAARLKAKIEATEERLRKLTLELDDKVRFVTSPAGAPTKKSSEKMEEEKGSEEGKRTDWRRNDSGVEQKVRTGGW